MKIHNRILLFLLASIAIYALALYALRRGSDDVGATLLDMELRDRAGYLDEIVDLERAPMERGIFDNTFWDDMVAFVRQPRPAWAKENIENGFPLFGLHFVWVYDPALSLVYSMPSSAGNPAAARVAPAALRAALDGGWFRHFYARDAGQELVEYFTAPIQPSADEERLTPPQGFLVGARRIDAAYFERLRGVTSDDVELQPWPQQGAPENRADPASGTIEIFKPLRDATDQPVAVLHAHHRNASLVLLRTSLDRYGSIFLAIAAINLLLVAIVIFAWAKVPLQRISESLDRQDIAPVARYLDAGHEFGTVARLLQNFLGQREALLTEIEMRKQYEQSLREARDLADRSARAKADFLSVMSHELRTPLNAVIGLASLLLDEQPRPDQVEDLTTLRRSAETLLGLINDVLDFNKLDAGKLVLEQREIDVRMLAALQLRAVEPQARAKGLALREDIAAEVPARVVGDPLRLAQILGNLLANAVKFTDRGSVTLAITAADETAGGVQLAFRVTDTGIGIAADKQARIFELFTQADSDTTRRYGGTGLGLTIVKKLLEGMGSAIAVDSAPGEGSTFHFVLTMPRVAASAAAPAPARTDLSGTRVLVVEDNAVNRHLAVTFLRRWGCEVDAADTGALALDQAAAVPYDLILMDLHMPGMNGVEATGRIRRDARGVNAQTPILAFTATSPADDDAEILAAGFDGFVVKPVDPNRLREIVERHLARAASPRSRAV